MNLKEKNKIKADALRRIPALERQIDRLRKSRAATVAINQTLSAKLLTAAAALEKAEACNRDLRERVARLSAIVREADGK